MHALSQVGGPTKSQLFCPTSPGHHISMEHRLRRKDLQLNSDTNASGFWRLLRRLEKEKNEKKEKWKQEKKMKNRNKKK